MVSVTINKARLQEELNRPINSDLYNKVAMMGVEVEEDSDTEIIIDVTPDRPDLLSQAGFTRALKAFLGIQPGLQTYETKKSNLTVKVDPSVRSVRPYTACAVATGLKLDDESVRELVEIQEKLHITFCRRRKRAAIGVYPMEAINGNITYKALLPDEIRFRPLEAKREMTMKQILREHPKGKEYGHLLEGLPRYPVFMDGKKNILSVPPIINSHLTGKVNRDTKKIFIESSGHDLRVCKEIVRMICAALADMGATIRTVDVRYGRTTERTPDMSSQEQEFYRYYVNRRLGTNIRKEQLPKLLGRMGLGFRDGRIRETHYALVPPYRVDFLHQIDVVEDVATAYGYENIRAELPDVTTVAQESRGTLFADKLREMLTGHGLLEAKNYHLLNSEFQAQVSGQSIVTLKSSVSEEYDSLRASLLPCMLQTLTRNKLHEYPQQLFEIGTVFSPLKNSVHEEQSLCIVLAGETDYTRIRQLVDALLRGLGLEGSFLPAEDARFLSGRAARLRIRDTDAGLLGEVHPRLLELAELTVPVAACEISLRSLYSP